MELTQGQFLLAVALIFVAILLPLSDKQTLARVILYIATGLGIFMLITIPFNMWSAVLAGIGFVCLLANEWINQ